MFAAIITVALVAADFNAADWLRSLRHTFRDVQSLSLDFTTTHTRPGQPAEKTRSKLRLVRTPDGRRVCDLTIWAGETETSRYTLWAGKVYHRDPAARCIAEYQPADNDPIRFAAEHFQPALYLLTDPPPAFRFDGGDQHYFLVRVTAPPLDRFRDSDLMPTVPPRVLLSGSELVLAVPSGQWPHIPADVPSYARLTTPAGECVVMEVLLLRVNAENGPTTADIADPTKLPAGWRMRNPTQEITDAWKAAERYAAEDRAQQRK